MGIVEAETLPMDIVRCIFSEIGYIKEKQKNEIKYRNVLKSMEIILKCREHNFSVKTSLFMSR